MKLFAILRTIVLFCTWLTVAIATSFAFTGGSQTYAVPSGVTGLDVTVCGAAGHADGPAGPGGAGGCIACTVTVTSGTTLYVFVGGTDGYNGGGTADGAGVGGG